MFTQPFSAIIQRVALPVWVCQISYSKLCIPVSRRIGNEAVTMPDVITSFLSRFSRFTKRPRQLACALYCMLFD